ncbi:MAG: hypothetical protein ACYCZP_14915, partial [Acidimicrobiales bacterium]
MQAVEVLSAGSGARVAAGEASFGPALRARAAPELSGCGVRRALRRSDGGRLGATVTAAPASLALERRKAHRRSPSRF